MAAGDIALGSFNLNDLTSYAVTEAHPPAAPIDIFRLPLGGREGSAVADLRVQENVAVVKGLVKGTTFQATEDNLDALQRALANGLQNLKLGYQDERYWKVRLMGRLDIERKSSGLYAYEAQMLADDPFAFAASASTTSATGAMTLVS